MISVIIQVTYVQTKILKEGNEQSILEKPSIYQYYSQIAVS